MSDPLYLLEDMAPPRLGYTASCRLCRFGVPVASQREGAMWWDIHHRNEMHRHELDLRKTVAG